MGSVTIDFVARDPARGGFAMVLVEEGPWAASEVEDNLRRIQDRLFCCVDAAIDGQLAELYPESAGKPVSIRLDAYNVAEAELRDFFERFSGAALELPDYAAALATCTAVSGISFELNVGRI